MISNILYLKRLVRLDYVYCDIIRQKQWNLLRKTSAASIIHNVLCYFLTGIENLQTALGHIMRKIGSHC